jgi:hypothetical protein
MMIYELNIGFKFYRFKSNNAQISENVAILVF